MAVEIERKWLVPGPLPGIVAAVAAEPIEQGYLVIAEDGSEARLRRKSGRPVLTVKSAGTLTRQETEIDLSEDQYAALWPATAGRRLTKDRHRLPDGIDVDVYTGALAGLIVAEVEFASESDADAFTAPDWFGTDVTADLAYKNHRLATRGRPDGA
ncbi:CYTH domain-containing protein [Conexibacter sp. DBS9H8]|uniref:CYTH domain-containing protein n=1 Tax=Conexibacter sp. DBS9H8 TaxID=2937801 RepID=UPI0020109FDA|nr:CYTH domain-containing protein [Conexibacter sp. DBS9H8]